MFLAICFVLMPFFHAPAQRFEAIECDADLSFDVTSLRERQIRLADNAGILTSGCRCPNPRAPVFVQSQSWDCGFRPLKQAKRCKGRARIAEDILAIYLHDNNITIELISIHHRRIEEVMPPVRQEYRVRLEPRSSGQREEQPV